MTLLSIINFVLNLPPAINYEKESRLSTEPPKMVIHSRNIPVAFICFLAASAIVLYMVTYERQYLTLLHASQGTYAFFDDLAKFITESNTSWLDSGVAFFVRVIGGTLSFGVFWALPASVFLALVIRAFLEAFPDRKNDVALLIVPQKNK